MTGGEVGCIERLNKLVDEKVAEFVDDAKRTGEPLPVEVTAVLEGGKVYQNRNMWLPVFFGLVGISILMYHCTSHPLSLLVAATVSFLWYDMFSGVLHKSLDNPEFIQVPILREPCLEFQWHHHIPQDLVSKPFLQVCGDLNLTVTILSVAYLVPYCGFNYRSPMALCLVGSKILMAYFGQLCHTMSHMPTTRRPNWVNWAQDRGLMISARDHLKHHKEYTDHFCIGSGMCNTTLSYMFAQGPQSKWFWLSIFAISLFADVPIFNYILVNYLGFQ